MKLRVVMIEGDGPEVLKAIVTALKGKETRGRPRLEDKRAASSKPWIAAGMSRATWYRRQKG